MTLNVPNQLTLLRLALIPVFFILFYLPFSWGHIAAAVVFVLAAFTDWLDGYLARRLNQTSSVGAFLDPVAEQIDAAAQVGTDRIELYTEPYASAFTAGHPDEEFERYARAAAHARALGLDLNAGHDLNLDNLPRFVSIPGVLEVSIGHALIADALRMGLAETVQAYLRALSGAV